MSEFDALLYCKKCQDRQMFNMGGSGQVGICMTCGFVITGPKDIKDAEKLAQLHYRAESLCQAVEEFTE